MAARAPPVLGFRGAMREALRSKTGLVGFAMLGFLMVVVIAVPFIAPVDLARAWGSREHWVDNPNLAAPEWTEVFAGKKLPRTVIFAPCFTPDTVPFSNKNGPEACPTGQWTRIVVRIELFGNITYVTLIRRFSYTADVFPSELRLSSWALFGQSASRVTVNWTRPDGTSLVVLESAPDKRAPAANNYPLSQMPTVREKIRQWATSNLGASDLDLVRIKPEVTLFAQAGPSMLDPSKAAVLKGDYTMKIEMVAFGAQAGLDVKMVIYGTVFGLAGTDDNRRDLVVGLLWGAPVALAFGTSAAVVIVLVQIVLGAIATWYGGYFDEVVQRSTDLFLILPILPILILIQIIYRLDIVLILLVLIAFGIFGSTTKIARSIVLQVKEEPYIEAAISYGASRARILFKHILPRLLPYTFALITLSVPGFIFLEASLSFLGVGDLTLPTWGRMLGDAYRGNSAFLGFWWWISFPAGGIVFATVAFSLLGYSFDKVLNPRLREE